MPSFMGLWPPVTWMVGCYVHREIRMARESLSVEITLDTNCNLPPNHEFSWNFSTTFNKDSNGGG